MGYKVSGVGEAQFSGKRDKLEPGVFEVEVEKFLFREARQVGPSLILEFTVTASNRDDLPAGSKRSWFIELKKDSANGNIKRLMYAILESKAKASGQALDFSNPDFLKKEIDPKLDDLVTKAVNDAHTMFSGTKLKCEVSMRDTKNVDKTTGQTVKYKHHAWSAA